MRFENLLLYPEPFQMRHYLSLSVPHAISKYASKKYDEAVSLYLSHPA